MYRTQTYEQIQSALSCVVSQGIRSPTLWSPDSRELAENVSLLAKMLADQLWAEGYELQLHEPFLPNSAQPVSARYP